MSNDPIKLLRVTTVPSSLRYLLKGQFTYMSSSGFEVEIASSKGEDAIALVKEEPVKFHELPLTRTINPVADLKAIWKAYRLIKKGGYQIVHSHTPKAGLVAMCASWLARIPIRMHTVAGLPLMESQGFKRKLLVFVERLTYRFATNVYPNSKGLKAYIEQNIMANDKKIKIIANGSSNGIDMDFFAPHPELKAQATQIRQDLGIPSDHKVGVFVGRVVADKGINELIRAFEALQEQHQDFHLLLVGPYEQELDPLDAFVLDQINNHPRIYTVGFQTNIRPYFLAGDFLVFPSYREGFPNAVIQAASLGLPVIASDINGCNEIVIDQENGLLVPPKTVAPMIEALSRMITDTDFFGKAQKAARSTIDQRFDQKLVWKALEEEYKKLAHV